MTVEMLTSVRELDSRTTAGIQVRLLWCRHDGRLWVVVLNTNTGKRFRVEVRDGERALDVFHHPYAYAAHHGISTHEGAITLEPAVSLAS